MSKIDFTPLAESDLEGIGDFIAQDNPRRALSFVEELRDQCSRIALAPLAYPARPELRIGLRSCAYGHYVVFFQADNLKVLIVRILHGAQDIQTRLQE